MKGYSQRVCETLQKCFAASGTFSGSRRLGGQFGARRLGSVLTQRLGTTCLPAPRGTDMGPANSLRLPTQEAVRRMRRTLSAVKAGRRRLGVPDGRRRG